LCAQLGQSAERLMPNAVEARSSKELTQWIRTGRKQLQSWRASGVPDLSVWKAIVQQKGTTLRQAADPRLLTYVRSPSSLTPLEFSWHGMSPTSSPCDLV
jgi:hypothetical protein